MRWLGRHLEHETGVFLLALAAGLPGAAVALALLARASDLDPVSRLALAAAVVVAWLALAVAVKQRVAYPLRTLANLIEALRVGDYSLRSRRATDGDALGEVMREANALGQDLREQRLGALEATALLTRVMEEVDVAVFAFDAAGRLALVNRAGERLLALPSERLRGRLAGELGLAAAAESGAAEASIEGRFPGGHGRFRVRRSGFRSRGEVHELVVLTDLSGALRDEERQAWQRLIRVLGHELNNSLAPIQSMAETLTALLARPQRPDDLDQDVARGLRLIADRAQSLDRFIAAYSRLARLPPPQRATVEVGSWVRRVVALEPRHPVALEEGPPVRLLADPDQLDQLLINLVRNAVDAALETGGAVHLGWTVEGDTLEVRVADDGPGLPTSANLFVPFFTTKRDGSGIGLALSRQIAELHGGSLALEPHPGGKGAVARLRLPLAG